MSLRSDINDVIDDFTPARALESRVRALVLADGRDRRVHVHRRSPWNNRFRSVATLVAAALVLSLVGGVILGGRFLRDWVYGESSQAYAVNQSELHGLESQPLLLPQLQAGATCPFSPDPQYLGGRYVASEGPVSPLAWGFLGTTNRGDWLSVTFAYEASHPGLVLVRGRDLQTNQPLVFTQFSLGPSGAIAAGPVLGTDRLNDKAFQVHPEAFLLDPWHLQPVNQKGTVPLLVAMFAIPQATLCWGFQFDGPGFSQTYVNGWDTAADKIGWLRQ